MGFDFVGLSDDFDDLPFYRRSGTRLQCVIISSHHFFKNFRLSR